MMGPWVGPGYELARVAVEDRLREADRWRLSRQARDARAKVREWERALSAVGTTSSMPAEAASPTLARPVTPVTAKAA